VINHCFAEMTLRFMRCFNANGYSSPDKSPNSSMSAPSVIRVPVDDFVPSPSLTLFPDTTATYETSSDKSMPSNNHVGFAVTRTAKCIARTRVHQHSENDVHVGLTWTTKIGTWMTTVGRSVDRCDRDYSSSSRGVKESVPCAQLK
jgi:hypothetical protein